MSNMLDDLLVDESTEEETCHHLVTLTWSFRFSTITVRKKEEEIFSFILSHIMEQNKKSKKKVKKDDRQGS